MTLILFVETLFLMNLLWLMIKITYEVLTTDNMVYYVILMLAGFAYILTNRMLILIVQMAHVIWTLCRN